MDELQMRRVKGDTRNSTLRGFFGAVLAIADHWIPERCKLHSNLIL
jgi:hypothetical protein